MRKVLVILFLTAGALFSRPAQVSETGNSQGLLAPGSSASKVKSLGSGEGFGGGAGKVVNGVNIFTGQPTYSIPLGAVTARTVSFPIVLNYSGNAKSQFEPELERAPTSWVGLGFDLSIPFVATNHKGTYASSDDAIFCNLGPYGGGQILTDTSGTKYFLSSNPYIKVGYDTASSGEYAGQFTRWIFTFPDGKKMLFGQDTNAQRFVHYNKGLIKGSPNTNVPARKFIYRWDLRSFYDTIPNRPPKNAITFEYQRITDYSVTNRNYIREGYIRNIKWVENGIEVERYEFTTSAKTGQYTGYATNEPRDGQKLFETQRLDSLKCYKEGVLTHLFKFDTRVNTPKMVLDSIRVFAPKPGSTQLKEDSGWAFTYDSGKFYTLTSVKTPNSRKDDFKYSAFSFDGTEGDDDPNGLTMRRGNHTDEIILPTSTSQLTQWSVENSCDERFCYIVVKDGDTEALPGDLVDGIPFTRKMYVEIHRNLGNYFDPRSKDSTVSPVETVTARFELGDPWTTPDKLKFIPAGDYVLLVNETMGNLYMYGFDGVRWADKTPFSGHPAWSGVSFGGQIKVFASTNYIVVQKIGPPSQLYVSVRKPDGWHALNTDVNNCHFNNKGTYWPLIRSSTSGGCLEWMHNDLLVATLPNMFVVADTVPDVVASFALDSTGQTFKDISPKFPTISQPSGFQGSTKMDLNKNIVSLTSASDYILLTTKASDVSIHALYFDGDSLLETMSRTVSGSGNIQAFPSDQYVILAHPGLSNNVKIFKKSMATGQLRFSDSSTVVATIDPNKFFQVRTHRKFFSFEVYKYAASIGLRPAWTTGTTNYDTHLYEVPAAGATVIDRTDKILGTYFNYFNLSFSPSDNMILGTHAFTGTSSRCNEDVNSGSCTIRHRSIKFNPDANPPLSGSWRIVGTNSTRIPMKPAHASFSPAARLGTWVVLDTVGSVHKVRFFQYQFDGKGFAVPEDQFVVTETSSHSLLQDLSKNKIRHQFNYAPVTSGRVEFNVHLQLPQFEIVDVKQVDSASSLGTHRTTFHLDALASPLCGKSYLLNGVEKSSLVLAVNADTLSTASGSVEPYNGPAWPRTLYVPRATAGYSKVYARNRSRVGDTAYYLNYNDTNGAPRFVLQFSRPQKIQLSQSIFGPMGFPKQTIQYSLTSQPNTDSLNSWTPGLPYRNTLAAASRKMVYDGYHLLEDSIWREQDQGLTDNDLRSGASPTFKLDEGWLPGSRITLRDSSHAYEVIESKLIKNKLSGALGEVYASSFYEGLRGDLVGVVQNTKLANCALLLGENGNAGMANLDYQGRWEYPGTTFSSVQAHTGRYGLKVIDHHGPTINLRLKDVRTVGFGFKVSAWIYSDTGTPTFLVERRRANNTMVNYYAGWIADGAPPKKKVWQRWEVRLSHEQVTDGSLFVGSADDYLRIWIGTGAPTGQTNKIIYVDDIVCLPSDASFSLTTYDKAGIVTSSTNSTHQTVFRDVGARGNVLAVRNPERRMFSQGAANRMGEN